MESSYLWPMSSANKSCVHLKFTPCYDASLKSHTDGVTLSNLYSYSPNRKTAVKIFIPLCLFAAQNQRQQQLLKEKYPHVTETQQWSHC